METYDYSNICRHVESETKSTQCQIEGSLPSWLHGFVLYNGPGITKIGTSEYSHAFDSAALLQKFTIEHGHIYYTSKFLQSETLKKNKKANAIVMPGFGTPGPSKKGLLSRVKDSLDFDKIMNDNALMRVVKMGSKYFALGETPFFQEIDCKSLDVIKRVDMHKLYKLASQSVHVIKDEEGFYYTTGQAISVGGPKYAILKFPQDGDIQNGKTVATLPCRWRMNPSYIHSMTFTQNYCIVIEPPLAVSIMDLVGDLLLNKPFIDGLHWKDEKVLFHIIDRRTWKPVSIRYVSDPFFFLHFANVYEESNHIVLDICTYPDSAILQSMFIKNLRTGREKNSPEYHATFCATLKRFIIPLEANESRVKDEELVTLPGSKCSARRIKNEIRLKSEDLCNHPFENPATNTKFSNGNRYVWGVSVSPNRENFNQILKIDLKTKETLIFKEERLHPSPPLFVPSPDTEKEDEGVILALSLTSGNEHLVTLLILDAVSMAEIGRATLVIETSVPMALHGDFFETIG